MESLQNAIIRHNLEEEPNSDLVKKTFENRIRGALWTSFIPYDISSNLMFENV
ncbi:MAG: hypothetical protein OEQ12_04965 [Nitrosopumilus sp.]|nr:hypothetical protein [Nitrosopumilus sp.]